MDDGVDGSGLSIELTTTLFGDGSIEKLGTVLDDRELDRVLVVSDEGVEAAGILDRALSSVAVDSTPLEATTEPSVADFGDLPDVAVDGVVAVGGGSCLDTAKVAALLMTHGGTPEDYLGEGLVPGDVMPIVAVPTTSGTGSQATQSAVVSFEGVKRGISDEVLRPDIAIVDPEVTVGLPATITARSGYDAFIHALESLFARDYRKVADRLIRYQGANPVTRPLSRQAIRLVNSWLVPAVEDGEDLDARRGMSLGSHLAGIAFSNAGLGAVHALASTVGGLTDRPHGECLSASVRVGLGYNRPVRQPQYAAVARDLGIAAPEASDVEAANALEAACLHIAETVGLPTSLSAVGLGTSDLDAIVENTLVQERRLATNPRKVTEDDLRTAIERAFD